MTEKSMWEAFFDAHAPIYEDNVFTKNTIPEVDFLLEELSLPARGSILDVGCGTGRHSIELAKHGYSVTGPDLSSEMLATAAGLSVLNLWGGTAGNWGRRPLDLDEIEIMIVARKTAEPSAASDAWQRHES